MYVKVLQRIFRIYQLCGFAPFTISSNDPSQTLSDTKWKFYNGFLLVYLSVLVVINIVFYETFLEEKPSEMLTYLSYIMICGMRALAVVCVMESTWKKQQQIALLQQLDSAGDILSDDLGINIDYNKFQFHAYACMGIWLTQSIILLSLIWVDVFKDYESIWERIKWVIFTIPLILSPIKYYQFIQYVKSLGLCFQIINIKLEKIYVGKNRLNTISKKSNVKFKTIQSDTVVFDEIVSLRRIYHLLWRTTAQLNRTFRWSLLLMIGGSFIIIVVNYYRTLVWILSPKKGDHEILTYFFMAVGHTFYLIQLSSVCYSVLQQV